MPDGNGAPTLGEVTRRLDDVSRRLDAVVQRIEASQQRFEATFVRIDLYERDKKADGFQMRGLEEEQHSLGKRHTADITRLDGRVDDLTESVDGKFKQQEERRRTDRALVFSALIAPILVLLIGYAVLGVLTP